MNYRHGIACSRLNSSQASSVVEELDTLHNLNRYNNKHCSIGNLNVNSLPSKFADICEWMEAFNIFSVQETKIDRTFPTSQFAIKGYNIYRRDRKKGGGRIMLFIRDTILSYQTKIKRKEIEAILTAWTTFLATECLQAPICEQ